MAANLSALAKSFDVPLRELVRELRRGYQSISECLEQTTAECDLRAAELADCQRQLTDAQRLIVEQGEQVAQLNEAQTTESNRCAALKEQLEAKQWELDQTLERLRLAEADDAQSKEWLQGQIEQNRQIHTEVERMWSENDRARTELAQLHAQLTTLTDTAVNAAELRGQLTAAHEELTRLRVLAANNPSSAELAEQLAAAHTQREHLEAALSEQQAQIATLTEAAISSAELRGRLAAAEQELAQLRTRASSPDENDLRAELAAAKADRERLETMLAQQLSQIATLSDGAVSAAELRGQLLAAQEEVTRLREQPTNGANIIELTEQLATARAERQQLEAALVQQQNELAALSDTANAAAELRGKLSAAEDEIARLRECGTSPSVVELTEQLAIAKTKRQQLETELTQQQDQLAALSGAANAAAELRGQLTAAQEELARLREQSSIAPVQPTVAEQLAALQQELSRLHKHAASESTDAELLAELAATKAEREQLEAAMAQQQAQIAALTEAAVDTAEQRGQLIAAHKELVRLRRQKGEISSDVDLREELAAAKVERQRVETVLADQQSRLAALAESLERTAELRDQLAAAQVEISRLQQQSAGGTGDAALQVELATARSERQQLENELDLVRQRAAELAESLDDQKRSIAAERQHWSEELRQLRRAVERQSEMVVRRARRAASGDPHEPVGATNGGGHVDPVIDTLREQFEALQKAKNRETVSASKREIAESKSYRVV